MHLKNELVSDGATFHMINKRWKYVGQTYVFLQQVAQIGPLDGLGVMVWFENEPDSQQVRYGHEVEALRVFWWTNCSHQSPLLGLHSRMPPLPARVPVFLWGSALCRNLCQLVPKANEPDRDRHSPAANYCTCNEVPDIHEQMALFCNGRFESSCYIFA